MKRCVVWSILFLISILTINVVSADIMPMGSKSLKITNKIENIQDFPDYAFISVGSMDLETHIIQEDGIIPHFYKFNKVSVYAVKKELINQSQFIKDNRGLESLEDFYDKKDYISKMEGIEVIRDVKIYELVSKTSPLEEVSYYYTVSLDEVKEKPDRTEYKRDVKRILYYTTLSVISLMIMIAILIRRKE